LEYKINDIDASTKELEATYTYDEIKSDLEKEVSKETKKIQIPGFRKGKVPASIIKQRFGDSLEYDASEKVTGNKFWVIADEHHLHPISTPKITDIKFKPGEDLSFKITYEVVPSLDVKDYTGQEVEVIHFEVKEKDIDAEIQNILKANSVLVGTDVVSSDGSCVLDVDLNLVDEQGNPLDTAKTESIQIDLANERVHPDIAKNAEGKKVGDTFNFTFDDEHLVKNAEGVEETVKDIFHYSALIKGIQKSVLPELDEELIRKTTKDKASTEEELRKEIRHDIEHYFEHYQADMLRNQFISMIIKANEFAPPDTLVKNFLDELVKKDEEAQKKKGFHKFDKAEARKRLLVNAENEIKWHLLKDAIIKKENIQVSDDVLTKMAEDESLKLGLPVEKLLNFYKSSHQTDRLAEEKLFDFLKENNTIKKMDISKRNKEEDVNE